MKKTILAIFGDPSDKNGSDKVRSAMAVCRLIIINAENPDNPDSFSVTLETNSCNLLEPEIVKELLSEENQIFIVTPENKEFLNLQEIFKENSDLFRENTVPPKYSLTRQQRIVMEHLDNDLRYKEIAEKLGISFSTVKNHISKIYKRMNVNNLCEAVECYREYKRRMN
jgi:DNA-binding CsgD family transcriptional regulator